MADPGKTSGVPNRTPVVKISLCYKVTACIFFRFEFAGFSFYDASYAQRLSMN